MTGRGAGACYAADDTTTASAEDREALAQTGCQRQPHESARHQDPGLVGAAGTLELRCLMLERLGAAAYRQGRLGEDVQEEVADAEDDDCRRP